MKKEKSQQGIALLWMVLVGALLMTSVEMALLSHTKKQIKNIEKAQLEASPTPLPSPTPEVAKDIGKDIQEMIDKQMSARDQDLLKILPPREKAELESAIREAQQVLNNIEVFDYTPPSIGDITKGLDQINKQTQEQIRENIEKQKQEFQPIDPKKIEEYFNQNPPAVPQEGKEFSPAEKEYYYRKNILKDPAFQY